MLLETWLNMYIWVGKNWLKFVNGSVFESYDLKQSFGSQTTVASIHWLPFFKLNSHSFERAKMCKLSEPNIA